MTTKEKIIREALRLFAKRGYSDVYVGDIAQAVGIKAPSLYKHFRSKQEIFDAILERMRQSYGQQTSALHINGNDQSADAAIYANLGEDALIAAGKGLFLYFLHNEEVRLFRKMLTIEQFHDSELSALHTKLYFDDPLTYQTGLLSLMTGKAPAETAVMALHFYAPLYFLLTLCDRHPEREPEAITMLESHIRQFTHIYQEVLK